MVDFKHIWKPAQTYREKDILTWGFFIETSKEQDFTIVEASNLYMRKAYEELYNLMKKSGETQRIPKMLITGISGFEKSCFLIYILIKLLKENAKVIF